MPKAPYSFSFSEFKAIIFEQKEVEISEATLQQMEESFQFLKSFAEDKVIYGVNTGFGPMAQYKIPKESLKDLQYNLIRSHASGTGNVLAEDEVKAVMLARLQTLSLGKSGISSEVILLMKELINREIYPVIFEHGGVGASGDLVQLAHLALVLIGEGEVFYKGKRTSTLEVFKAENLKELAKLNCIRVSISITSLAEETRRILEPRTASIKQRLKTVETLAENDIPVNVMVAPIIPFINSHEILPIVKAVSEAGASSVGYTVVRLNGAIAEIFSDWIKKTLPDKAERVLHQIEACHGGNLNDSRFGMRMKGEGEFSKQIAQQFKIAKAKYLKNKKVPEMDTSHYLQLKNPQYKLF